MTQSSDAAAGDFFFLLEFPVLGSNTWLCLGSSPDSLALLLSRFRLFTCCEIAAAGEQCSCSVGAGRGEQPPEFTTGAALHDEVVLWKCHSHQEILPSLESWL